MKKEVQEGRSPSFSNSPSPSKERGIQGVRLINNLALGSPAEY